jgi:hypothetical protein
MEHAFEREKDFKIVTPSHSGIEYGAREYNAQVFSCPFLSSTKPDDLKTQLQSVRNGYPRECEHVNRQSRITDMTSNSVSQKAST